MSVSAFPLSWPVGRDRTMRPVQSRFDTSFVGARNSLISELRLIGARQPVLSTSIELRLDGQPYAGRKPVDGDTGVAVYFQWKEREMVFACDKFNRVECNIQSIVKTINAIRGIERWGSSDMMERAFRGFSALPAPVQMGQDWSATLNLTRPATIEEVVSAHRRLAKQYHSDKTGEGDDKMAAINVAKDAAIAELSA